MSDTLMSSHILASDPETYLSLRKGWEDMGRQTVALVPTMGALHEGHLSLIRMARQHADRVVVSIFVNPLQFGPQEDFQKYPRALEADLASCEALGVDCVFAPVASAVYPEGLEQTTKVVPPARLADRLCGLARPGHFTGVATVVAKLFHMIQPDVAIFGEKDGQQLAIIQQMVRDLDFSVQILPHPIVREPSGLAMSSRNRYLQTEMERQASLVLYQTLQQISKTFSNQHVLVKEALQIALQNTLSEMPSEAVSLVELDYLEAVDAHTLQPIEHLRAGDKVFMAAKIKLSDGQTVRLIDNITLSS